MDEQVSRPDDEVEADDDYEETRGARLARWLFWAFNVGFLVTAVVVPGLRALHYRF